MTKNRNFSSLLFHVTHWRIPFCVTLRDHHTKLDDEIFRLQSCLDELEQRTPLSHVWMEKAVPSDVATLFREMFQLWDDEHPDVNPTADLNRILRTWTPPLAEAAHVAPPEYVWRVIKVQTKLFYTQLATPGVSHTCTTAVAASLVSFILLSERKYLETLLPLLADPSPESLTRMFSFIPKSCILKVYQGLRDAIDTWRGSPENSTNDQNHEQEPTNRPISIRAKTIAKHRSTVQKHQRRSAAYSSIGCDLAYADVPESIRRVFPLDTRLENGKRHYIGVHRRKGEAEVYSARYRHYTREIMHLGQFADKKTAALVISMVRAKCSQRYWKHSDISQLVRSMCSMNVVNKDWEWAADIGPALAN